MAGLDQFWTCVWQISWQSAALGVVVLLVNFLLRRVVPASWRCALWLLVAVRLMVPMLPGSPWSVFNLFQQREAIPVLVRPVGHTTVTVRYGPISFDRNQPTQPASPEVHRNGWMLTGTAIWLIGILILLGRQIVNEWRGAAMARNMPGIMDARVLEMIERCRKKMKLWRQVRAVSSTNVRTPAICGFWRATLILPAENDLSGIELQMVILHELAHARRWDLQIDRLLSILRAVHWFNPMAWLMVRHWRSEREMACDEKVLQFVGENQRQEYGRVILDMVERFSNLRPAAGAVGLFETSSDLHRRIRMIGSYSHSRIRWMAGMFILIGVAGCLLTDVKAENATAPATEMVQPQASDEGELTRIYEIWDLVARDTSFSKFMNVPTDDFDNIPKTKPDPKKVAEQHAKVVQSIIKAIHDAMPANSWKDKGGKGRIDQIPGQDQLIIAQTADGHEKISKLLAVMRHGENRQVNIEAHFLALDNRVLKKMRFLMDDSASSKNAQGGAVYLDDRQVGQLLKLSKADKGCSLLSAPRVTVFNNQEAYLAIEQQQSYVADLSKVTSGSKTAYTPITGIMTTGPILDVQPTAGPDDKFVTVRFHARLTEFVALKDVRWKNDPEAPKVQKPVIDVHEAQSGHSVFSIPNASTALLELKDTQKETPGRSTWLLIRPTILEVKDNSPPVWDGHGHVVKE